ncbi:MAG: MBOAT family protein [Clostridia bacterium]|nr:MBOAT family protein [Clostridia bacterium]
MIFTSFEFIGFIAIVLLGYFCIPKKVRWIWLTGASVYFYLCASVKYSVFLLFSAASVYLFGLYIAKCDKALEQCELPKEEKKAFRKKNDKKKYFAIAVTLVVNLGILGFLKYADFAIESVSKIVRVFAPAFEVSSLSLVLPLGISFYTFMAAGYAIDVYRGISPAEKNPIKLLLFLSYFPHIMQGPIDRYENLAPQLFEGHAFDFDRVARGLRRMLWGFFQKLIIADRLAMLVNQVFDRSESYSGAYLLLAVFVYAIQIYADFAGYMDIALGASQVMGIYPEENFDSPYLSASVPEFWRRWHMSLGSWFRDYLFYPVMRSGAIKKLSKKLKKKYSAAIAGTVSTCIALAVVWFTTGLWHGAAWHYIAWGVYYGILIILSTITKPYTDKIKIDREKAWYKIFSIVKTFLLVLFGYILFRANNMTHAFIVISRIFTKFPVSNNAAGQALGLDRADLIVAAIAIIILIIVDIIRYRGKKPADFVTALPLPIRWTLVYIAIIAVLVFGIYGPGYDAASFIYFQF